MVFVIGWSLINSWTSSDWKDSHPHKPFSAKEYEPLSEIVWWDYTILSWDNHLIVSELLNTLNLCTAIITWWVECFFFCLWSLWYLIGHPLFWCSYDFLSCCCISFLIKWKEKWTTTLSDSFSFKTTVFFSSFFHAERILHLSVNFSRVLGFVWIMSSQKFRRFNSIKQVFYLWLLLIFMYSAQWATISSCLVQKVILFLVFLWAECLKKEKDDLAGEGFKGLFAACTLSVKKTMIQFSCVVLFWF